VFTDNIIVTPLALTLPILVMLLVIAVETTSSEYYSTWGERFQI